MTDYKLYNIVDSRLEDITSELSIPVTTGAEAVSYYTFNAQGTGSTTQLQFNINVTSLTTAVDRHVLLQSDVYLKLDITGGTTAGYWKPDEVLFEYGSTNALQAFPLNSLFSTIQANINSSNVSVNTREVMPALLKLYNYEELAKYNSMTPSLVDSFYQNYADGIGSNNNVLSNYSTGGFAKEYQPRGVFPVTLYSINAQNQLIEIPTLQIVADATGTSPYASFVIKFTTTEPLLFLSPFISGNSNNKAALVGINSLNFTLNFGDATRVMSNASYADNAAGVSTKTISTVSLYNVTNSKMLITMLTIPKVLYEKLLPRNVVNYNQYQSYNNIISVTVPKNYGTASVSFSNVQLKEVPTKFLIYVTKSNLTSYDSNSFLVIDKCTINFANKTGLLGSATPIQLYNMSNRNSLQMNYYEFSGKGVSQSSDGLPTVVPTIGSVIVVDPAIDLYIADTYSNMSTGQFSIQFDLTIRNQSSDDINQVNVYLTCINSGMFIIDSGVSTQITGMLTQAQVLETKAKDAIMDKDTYEKDIVGGSIENIGGIHKHMKLNFHKASEKEKQLDEGVGEVAPKIGTGSGMSAAGMPKRKPRTRKHVHKYSELLSDE